MTRSRGRGARVRAVSIVSMVLLLLAPVLVPGAARAQDAPQRVSLAAVLAHADEHAPLVVVARARLEEGVAEREGAEPLLRDPLRLELAAGPRVTDQGQADTDAIIALSQPLEVAGERGARLDRAAAIEAHLAAQLESARWEVHRQVHFAFHEAIEMRVRRDSALRWRELAASVLEIARARAAAGDVGEIEVVIAEAELARARQELVASSEAYDAARLVVCELSGWAPSDPPHPAGDLDAPRDIAALDDLLARALSQHPSIVEHEAELDAARARAAAADRDAWPTLDLGVQLAREGAAGSPAAYIGLLTVGIGIPVWQQSALERAQARAATIVADARIEALRGTIEARVRRARGSAVAAAERVEIHQREVLPRMVRYLDALRGAYELGEIDALALSTARRLLFDAERDALTAFAEYHRALADLEAEVGAEVVTDVGHGREDRR